MTVARAAGYTNYKTAGFIPELWSTLMVAKLYDATYLSVIANSDYEGEIKAMGDKVHITLAPDVTIVDYQVGQKLNYEVPTAGQTELVIDRAKAFQYKIDSIDKHQTHLPLMEKFAEAAAAKMKIAMHRDVVRSVYADVAAANQGATAGVITGGFNLGTTAAPVALTKVNVLDFIVDMNTVLDEQNVPDNEGERYILLPAKMCGMLKKSDLKDASITGDGQSVMRNGRLGVIDRCTVYRDNGLQMDAGGKFHLIAGHKMGLTFAAQMAELETVKHPDYFGDFVRGLNVYGFEVINDVALAHAVVTLS